MEKICACPIILLAHPCNSKNRKCTAGVCDDCVRDSVPLHLLIHEPTFDMFKIVCSPAQSLILPSSLQSCVSIHTRAVTLGLPSLTCTPIETPLGPLPETKTGNFVAMKGSTAHAPVSSGSDPVRTEASPKGYPTKGGKASKQASVRTMKSRAGLEVEYSKETGKEQAQAFHANRTNCGIFLWQTIWRAGGE
eukprot:1159994-Pelagomonas_calceolata.AAC.3